MVPHPEAIVTPYDGRAARGAAGWDAAAAFAVFLVVAAFGDEPVEAERACGEGAGDRYGSTAGNMARG